MHQVSAKALFMYVFYHQPTAYAELKGCTGYRDIDGSVSFYQTEAGTIVVADICGLPTDGVPGGNEIFAFQITNDGRCKNNNNGNGGNPRSPDVIVLQQENVGPPADDGVFPSNYLPILYGNQGYAFIMIFSDRVIMEDIIGKYVAVYFLHGDGMEEARKDIIAAGEIKRV